MRVVCREGLMAEFVSGLIAGRLHDSKEKYCPSLLSGKAEVSDI